MTKGRTYRITCRGGQDEEEKVFRGKDLAGLVAKALAWRAAHPNLRPSWFSHDGVDITDVTGDMVYIGSIGRDQAAPDLALILDRMEGIRALAVGYTWSADALEAAAWALGWDGDR